MSATGGGETKADISGWTVDTLHAHIQTIINDRDRLWLTILDEREKRHEQRFTSSERAVAVSQENAEKWRDNANEWRSTMNDKDKTYMTKEAADARFHAVETSLGKNSLYSGYGYIVGFAGFIVAILAIIFYVMKVTGH